MITGGDSSINEPGYFEPLPRVLSKENESQLDIVKV